MSHYVKVVNGIVVDGITAEADFIATLEDSSEWIQTSYNTRGGIHYAPVTNGNPLQTPDNGVALRANYAGIGYTYDAEHDVFYAPRPLDRNGQPCDSWTIGAPTWIWNPPIPRPTGALYEWDEKLKEWL